MFRQNAVVSSHGLRDGHVNLKRTALMFDETVIIQTNKDASDAVSDNPPIEQAMRGGSVCLNSFPGFLSGASAGVRPPREATAG